MKTESSFDKGFGYTVGILTALSIPFLVWFSLEIITKIFTFLWNINYTEILISLITYFIALPLIFKIIFVPIILFLVLLALRNIAEPMR